MAVNLSYLATLQHRLTENQFVRHVAILGGSTTLNQILVMASALVLARIYRPTEIGTWTVFITGVLLLQPLLTLRYELALVLPKENDVASTIVFLSCLITLIVSLVALVGSLFYSNFISVLLHKPALKDWFWLGSPLLLATGVTVIANSWLTRHKRFNIMALALLIKTIVTSGLQITAGFTAKATFLWLIWGSVLGQLAVAGFLVGSILKTDRLHFTTAFSWRQLMPMAREYIKFPLYNFPYSIVGGLSSSVTILLLGVYFSSVEVGLYAMAFKLTYMPVGLITGSLRQVFFQKSVVDFGTKEFERFVYRILVFIILITVGPTVLFVFNARWIFEYAIGAEWAGSADYAIWLILPAATLFLTSWLDRLYDVAGRQRLALQLELCYDVVVLAGVVATAHITRNAEMVAATFGIITALYNLLWLGVTFAVSGFSGAIYWKVYGLFTASVSFVILCYLLSTSSAPTLVITVISVIVSIVLGKRIFSAFVRQGTFYGCKY